MQNGFPGQAILQVGERESLALAKNSCVVQFMSSTAGTQVALQTNADIPNTVDGYYNDLITFSSVYTYAAWRAALADKTFFLRPIGDLQQLAQAKRARLTGYQFRAFDFTDPAADLGPSFRGVETGGWQPNFFRPVIQISDNNVITGQMKSGYFQQFTGAKNFGDLSIGLPLPLCQDANAFMNDGTGGISNINIYAPCGRITGTDSVQAYPVLCTLYFILNEI